MPKQLVDTGIRYQECVGNGREASSRLIENPWQLLRNSPLLPRDLLDDLAAPDSQSRTQQITALLPPWMRSTAQRWATN